MTHSEINRIGELARARGILVSLEVTCWSGRRLDRRVTEETAARHGAESEAGRWNKNLLGGKVESFNAVLAAAQASRNAFYDQTLPWSDKGSRLLAVANYDHFTATVRERRETWKAAVQTFKAEYVSPGFLERCAARLGDTFNPADYPTAAELDRFFTYRVGMSPLPAASDLRVDLPPEILQHIARSVETRVGSAVETAVRDGWTRLSESVQKIRDRLREISGAEAGRLHAALFENARETAETLRRLNILEDPQLDAMAGRIIAELGGIDASAIRKDPAAMENTATAADAILSDMTAIYGGFGA